jgi:hypothetical protein
MTETFLLLFAGGVMLAAAISDPKQVTLHWLRLAGIIALCLVVLSAFFAFRGNAPLLAQGLTALVILAQLAFVQIAFGQTQRFFAALTFVCVVLMPTPSNKVHLMSLPPAITAAGVASMTGLALMDMLLGHAYLTASKMTISPFRRLNLALAGAILFRIVCAVGLVFYFNARTPLAGLWPVHGLFILTRWLVGLLIPAVFVYMAHDCIKRRSTQSATGILYVAGVLILIGEILGLYLARQTGLPF